MKLLHYYVIRKANKAYCFVSKIHEHTFLLTNTKIYDKNV